MADKYIIAHDLGTSSNKAVLVSIFGDIIHVVRKSYPIYHPQPGFAEQESADWWNAICTSTKQVLQESQISPNQIVGITFSAQMQSLLPVDRDGEPLMRGISWLDSRGFDIIQSTLWKPPRIMGYNIINLLKFLYITGGAPGQAGKDIIGKILWLKENHPDIFANTHKFLDVKDYIIFKLTGNYITSADLAVIWWLSDTRKHRNQWHSGLCKLAGITTDKLCEIHPSCKVIGQLTSQAASETGLRTGTPVINGCGDLSAASLGSGAIRDGELHVHIGTSGWVAGHFKKRKIDISHYAGCIGSAMPEDYYIAMAHQETAGACLEWIRKLIGENDNSSNEDNILSPAVFKEFDELVSQAPAGANGLIFTPWMFGERCPIDDDYVRSSLHNLSLGHTRAHILRSVFEGISFNLCWALHTLEKMYQPVKSLNMIGGGANSNIWCQIMADIMQRTIKQVSDPQLAGARGVALLASVALGFIPSMEAVDKYIAVRHTYQPNHENYHIYSQLFKEFKSFYFQNRRWFRRVNKPSGTIAKEMF